MTDPLEKQAKAAQDAANKALAAAHPRQSVESVVGNILYRWDYLEMSAIGGPRKVMVTQLKDRP